jgi:hypothetical protein
MKIDLYATCWNEERMLPFFFNHYDKLVDHYYIYDNQSTDGSLGILSSHPNVTILPFVLEGDSLIEAAIKKLNDIWKPSIGNADWVTVCNIDELFWHPNLYKYLTRCNKKGITYLISEGYQMITKEFPNKNVELTKKIITGERDKKFDKPSFFNPNKITHSGFTMGRHSATPKGCIILPKENEILLLHYKYLGLNYVKKRHAELNARRRKKDVAKNYGHQYDAEQTIELYKNYSAKAKKVIPNITSIIWRNLLGPRPVKYSSGRKIC